MGIKSKRILPHGPAHILKGIYHVVEPKFERDVLEGRFVEDAIAVLPTGVEEQARRGGALLVCVAKMAHQVLSLGQAEFIQRYFGSTELG